MTHIDISREVFNTKQVCQILEITARRVRYWDSEGLLKPSVRLATGRGSQRMYCYQDLLALHTIMSFRADGVSLQKIRRSVQYLRKHLPDVSRPLSFCTLITNGETVLLVGDEKTLKDTAIRQGQNVFRCLSIAAIDQELRTKVLQLTSKRVVDLVVGDYTYQVEIEPDHDCGGYVATVAGLPGCITQGDTLDEVMEMADDAIKCYLEAVSELKREGVTIPIKRRRTRRKARA